VSNTQFADQETEILIMLHYIRWKLVVLLHVIHAVSLFSQTFLIETRDEIPRQEMELRQKIQITSLETGVMDILFDEGYIVFDRISIKNEKSAAMMDREAIEFAVEQEVDLLLVLVPNERGTSWSLVQIEHAKELSDGFADISIIELGGSEMKRWISLGNSLAASLLSTLEETQPVDAGLSRQKGIGRYQ